MTTLPPAAFLPDGTAGASLARPDSTAKEVEAGPALRHAGAYLCSQDAHAEKVYVSRQTISSWENGKTYPDVQSLLLLSTVFGVTVDALI